MDTDTHELLTPGQHKVLAAFRRLTERGLAPAVSDIAREAGFASKGATHRYIDELIEAGYLERGPAGSHRSLALVDTPAPGGARLPYLGRIAAGGPIESPTGEDVLDLAKLLCAPERYVLTAEGESMADAGIQPGDLLIMDSARAPQSGDLVAALVDGTENTLKSIYFSDDGRVKLKPANAAFSTLTLESERVTVQGVLVFHIRGYL